MIEYIPDNWVIIKIDDLKKTYYKVLAGWSGGYITGSSWRINSGITKMEAKDLHYIFYGKLGSYYVCDKKSYGLRLNNAHIWEQLKQKFTNQVSLMDENTNWSRIEW